MFLFDCLVTTSKMSGMPSKPPPTSEGVPDAPNVGSGVPSGAVIGEPTSSPPLTSAHCVEGSPTWAQVVGIMPANLMLVPESPVILEAILLGLNEATSESNCWVSNHPFGPALVIVFLKVS